MVRGGRRGPDWELVAGAVVMLGLFVVCVVVAMAAGLLVAAVFGAV